MAVVVIEVEGRKVRAATHPLHPYHVASKDGAVYYRPALYVRGKKRTDPRPRADYWQPVKTFPSRARNRPPYLMFRLSYDGTDSMAYVHRFVLECWRGLSDDEVARHLDGNHLNNSLRNLAYGTVQDNVDDAKRHIGNYAEGQRNGRAKLSEEDVLKIRRMNAEGADVREIAEHYPGVSQTAIRLVVQRKTWKHVEGE